MEAVSHYPPHDPCNARVAVDFDGTLASGTWPNPSLGDPDPDAIALVQHYFAQGCEVVVFTARPESHFGRIREWLEQHGLGGIVYDVVNRKPVACLYFDDRAVRWPL